jgi:hypothetical protein
MADYGPIDPIADSKQAVRESQEWDSQIWQMLYVGFNLNTPGLNLLMRLLAPIMLDDSCPTCEQPMRIPDANKWRMTGSGLICNLCAQAKPNSIVAADSLEILQVRASYNVELPERARALERKYTAACQENVKIQLQEIADLTAMLETAPDNAWLYIHRARKRQGILQTGWEADLLHAVELAPDDPMIRRWRRFLLDE